MEAAAHLRLLGVSVEARRGITVVRLAVVAQHDLVAVAGDVDVEDDAATLA